MLSYEFTDNLDGCLKYSSEYQTHSQQYLYTFLFMLEGSIQLEVDGCPLDLNAGDLISLSPLQHCHIKYRSDDSCYNCLQFNSNFYCIYGNDHEVSCSGLLFNGSSEVFHIQTTAHERQVIIEILKRLEDEFALQDRYQAESLRILLKRYIIIATRAVKTRSHISIAKERSLEEVRQFVNLVDQHFLTYKQVQDYAKMMNKSSKTLTSYFKACQLEDTPLKIIHKRLIAEANRRILYSNHTATEIAEQLGFDSVATLSRLFKRINGISIQDFRRLHSELRG